ncbi:MAG: YhcH/YjgK/YiaL family protein, partial [Clostridia bacterium]
MIFDKRENAYLYEGISTELDIALRFVQTLVPERLAVNTRTELRGTDVFYSVSEPMLSARAMNFEFHRSYVDIHVPITGEETIALCSAASRPQDTFFDGEKDIGFFQCTPTNAVVVPEGWFLVCFPDDAHVPCI